jgi:hypothetical protein
MLSLPLKKTKESVTGHLQRTHGCQLWACSWPTCEQQQEKKERNNSRIIVKSKAKKMQMWQHRAFENYAQILPSK